MSIIIVAGAIANKPFNGGAAWTRLNYVLGLQQLGFDVYFVEQIRSETCVDEQGRPTAFETSANRRYFDEVTRCFGLSGRCALIEEQTLSVAGVDYRDLLQITSSAALLVNISGHLDLAELKGRVRRAAYIDLDPGFTQFWHAEGRAGPRLAGHDYFFSVAENIGRADCSIPTNGLRWRPTRQPLVLNQWPVSSCGETNRFTTVASWRGPYGPVVHEGRLFGLKVHQFRKFVEVPLQANGIFEIALDIHEGDHRDRQLLHQNGWRLVDPKQVAAYPDSFRRYVQTSGAEFSVAQQIYVETRSGWFSDRTVRYLASGKPVLIEDTGFSHTYPVGEGIITFSTVQQAVAGSNQVVRDYSTHARAARLIAETYFDSDLVLTELLEQTEVCA